MECRYCDKRNPRPIISYSDLKVCIDDGELAITYEGCTDRETEYYPINYCPMCGRKLGDIND